MAAAQPPPIKAIVLTKTCEYRHECIPATIAALASLPCLSVRATENAAVLPRELPGADLLILGHNTGRFLEGDEVGAVRGFVARGGGVVGIHCCTAGLKESPWYGELLGAVFDGHPEPQWGLVTVDDPEHFITRDLPAPLPAHVSPTAPPCPPSLAEQPTSSTRFAWFDEWYNFRADPQWPPPGSTVLCSVDETTYHGGQGRASHPLAWCHEVADGGSRVFYTALGHFDEMYHDPWFTGMLDRGVRWAARQDGATAS